MIQNHLGVRMFREPWLLDSIKVFVHDVRYFDGQKTVYRAEPLMFKEVPKTGMAEMFSETFTMSQTDAQQMMDELWSIGIRPTEGAGSAGQMAATQKHLDDMRRLVFESRRMKP